MEIFGEDPWEVLASGRREVLERLTTRAAQEEITSGDDAHDLALASRRETFERKLHRSGLTKAEFGALLAAFAQENLK